ncbi:phosphatidylserine decarboxylase [Desulfobacter latus]|uniref:Phosphatidylserine decarboxylase n=1 Tax=Desulfobacter latus TaxID=2292 RepID=A0A850SXR7_9BACT|nr:phosphatidylserine decarboxylase [Desulfobacter latus]NWH06114.1 phosphatidylserine decarboxylase [Desulfobacter latus]
MKHQYIDRKTRQVRTEILKADPVINAIYSPIRENSSFLFHLMISARMSSLIGAVSYDLPFFTPPTDAGRFLAAHGIDLSEVLGDPAEFDTFRKVFERKIRYEQLRPMPEGADAVVSPADSRLLVGSFSDQAALFIKGKFFDFKELIGRDKPQWLDAFDRGGFAVTRLTPDKYHYNHTPVAGTVLDIYEINGHFHSCNPGAVVREVTPYSKNRRVVTIIDTDVPGGTGCGLVCMVEVVAMMIGKIVQCYSRRGYESPREVVPGLFMEKGCPKSLYRPGSSTTIVIFQKQRICFSKDLLENQMRSDVSSRFSEGFGKPLVETEVAVRSGIGHACCSDKTAISGDL